MQPKFDRRAEEKKFNVGDQLAKAMGQVLNNDPDVQQQLHAKDMRIQQLSDAILSAYQDIAKMVDKSKVPINSSNDPVMLLQVCVKLCGCYIAYQKLQPPSNLEEVLRSMLETHPGSCSQAEYAASKALQNYKITKELSTARLQISTLEAKLELSQQNCRRVTEKATSTVQAMKEQFDSVLVILEATEQRLHQTLAANEALEMERKKLQMMIDALRRCSHREKDLSKNQERQVAVIRNQFQKKVQLIQKAYRTWWNDSARQPKATPKQ